MNDTSSITKIKVNFYSSSYVIFASLKLSLPALCNVTPLNNDAADPDRAVFPTTVLSNGTPTRE